MKKLTIACIAIAAIVILRPVPAKEMPCDDHIKLEDMQTGCIGPGCKKKGFLAIWFYRYTDAVGGQPYEKWSGLHWRNHGAKLTLTGNYRTQGPCWLCQDGSMILQTTPNFKGTWAQDCISMFGKPVGQHVCNRQKLKKLSCIEGEDQKCLTACSKLCEIGLRKEFGHDDTMNHFGFRLDFVQRANGRLISKGYAYDLNVEPGRKGFDFKYVGERDWGCIVPLKKALIPDERYYIPWGTKDIRKRSKKQ